MVKKKTSKQMQYRMTLFIAPKAINSLMESCDMKPNYKAFVILQKVDFSTTSIVNEDYFMKLIKESKKEKEIWIPAIEFCGVLYHDNDIKEISDGKRTLFLRKDK